MPLENFGSILNFAEELENRNKAFFLAATINPACSEHKDLFAQFAADGEKWVKIIQRARRENATEMIMEPIRDFSRARFQLACVDAAGLSASDVLACARQLEESTVGYYTAAAAKIKALPEVALVLRTTGKKHAGHLQRLPGV